MRFWILLTVFIVGLIGFGCLALVTLVDDDAMFFLWLALGIIWLVAWIYGASKKYEKKIEALPLLTESVTIISKLQERIADSVYHYFIVFEFPDKSRQKTSVNKEQYTLVRENEVGTLNYKQFGKNLVFVDFVVTGMAGTGNANNAAPVVDKVAELKRLEQLFYSRVITQEEYDTLKAKIIEK